MSNAARLRRVLLLDTAVASTNLGDEIIMEAVRRELAEPLREAFVTTAATHEVLGAKGRRLAREADLAIAGGTNLISSHMGLRPLWRLRPRDAWLGLDVVLMGVGWYQPQRAPDAYTRWLLRRVLHPTALHSVRDSYTARHLAAAGISRVVNTGCPTLWQLDAAHCARIPRDKADEVVTTLNTYLPDPAADRELLALLQREYRRVHAWVQTPGDHEYIRALAPDVEILPPSVAAFDALLASAPSLDYVGNRLHGGLRALQRGRRTIIVEIDNRAREMGRDFGLPTVARTDFARLLTLIRQPLATTITLPMDAIATWKDALRATLEATP